MLLFTKEELETIYKQQLDRLVYTAGDMTHLSKMLDIPYPTVQGWVERGRISKQGARQVEQHPTLSNNFRAVELRPDLDV